MDQRWRDLEAPWWAKLRRARTHISEVRHRVSVLQQAQPWSIQREPAGPDGWTYRFKIHPPIPADLSAAVGDAVANMRAALDYIAYELARHHVGTLSDAQEAATAFPICKDKAAFDQFFTAGRNGPVRAELYGDAERKALQCVQPFALTDERRAWGVDPATDTKTDLLTDHAYGLNTLWNIDKHRRLPGLAWVIEGPVFFSGDATDCRWIPRASELVPLSDGTVLSELYGPPASGPPPLEPKFNIDLVLTDDPSPYPSPLGERLERLHQSLTGWVVPRIFIVADGNPPPIMISSG